MGSKDDVPAEPDVKPVFVEDMNDAELASAVSMDFIFAQSISPAGHSFFSELFKEKSIVLNHME